MDEYRVNLEMYDGPLDLLLYLIRREEVDIYDIPIARITEQYVQYVGLLKEIDPNLAGEFLVMAATLIEIKTRMMLPTPTPEQAEQEGLELDPRAALIRQLLEYKAFKDAAGDLREAYLTRRQKFGRRRQAELPDKDSVDIEDVQVWDLLDAFSNMMAAIGVEPGTHDVIYDDTPLELHAADILDRLSSEGALTFSQIFEGRTARTEIVGLFVAMLELIRRRRIVARQGGNFAEVYIDINPDAPAETAEDADQADAAADDTPSEPSRNAAETPRTDGQYVSQEDRQGSIDEHGGAENPAVEN